MTPEEKTVAAKAIDFIEAAQGLTGDGSAMDGVDTSVAGIGDLDPVLDDERLAGLKEDLANERIAADVIRDLVKIARSAAMALAG